MQIVEEQRRKAPETAPTHVFIGGSRNLRKILLAVKEKNLDVQIVLTAISLDTMAEVMEAVDEGLQGTEIVQIQWQRPENWASMKHRTNPDLYYFGGRRVNIPRI